MYVRTWNEITLGFDSEIVINMYIYSKIQTRSIYIKNIFLEILTHHSFHHLGNLSQMDYWQFSIVLPENEKKVKDINKKYNTYTILSLTIFMREE